MNNKAHYAIFTVALLLILSSGCLDKDNVTASASQTTAWQAFDGRISTSWQVTSHQPQHIIYDLEKPTSIKAISITGLFKGFEIQASQDKNTWKRVYYGTRTASMSQKMTYPINDVKAYRYFKLIIYSANLNTASVNEIDFQER